MRGLDGISFDAGTKTITVGAGATLGAIYKALRAEGVAFIGGSCPTVAIGGHLLGGGHGLLARARGLACDSLKSVTMIDGRANTVVATNTQNADLFWASQGGGGGSFGIATQFTIQTHSLSDVTTFKAVWILSKARAIKLIDAWQRWAPQAPREITALLKVGKNSASKVMLRCIGQSTGPAADLGRELRVLTAVEPTSQPMVIHTVSFFEAVEEFAGGTEDEWEYEVAYTKEKSDYVKLLSQAGMGALIDGLLALPVGRLVVMLNAYGGAINDLAPDATAFPHRSNVGFLMHYYSRWSKAGDTKSRLKDMRAYYSRMRRYVLGGAYVNYCDMDLKNWETAYWGNNLSRLKAIKRRYDPLDLFHQGQGIRL